MVFANQGFCRIAVVACFAALGLLPGCSSYKSKADAFLKPYEAGQFDVAATAATDYIGPISDPQKVKSPDQLLKVDTRDAIVFRLEQGALLRAAGKIDESIAAFRHAEEIIDKVDQQPEIKVSGEVGAAVTNLTIMDYKGYCYDRQAMDLYLALNYMQAHDIEKARIALRALQERQQQAEEHFKKKIESVETKNSKDKDSVDMEKTVSNPAYSKAFKDQYGDDAPLIADRSAYRAYSNPFGEYLMGVYFMSAGVGGSDGETAATAFKRVLGMLPNNPYVAADLAVAEKVASGAAPPPTTYVFFETGLAPIREQITIHIPVFIFNLAVHDTRVDYIGAAFPKLKFRGGYMPYITVGAGGNAYKTDVLTDMDTVIKKDFNNELPIVITRTVIATATKAAIAYGINEATKSNEYANIAARIGTTLYQIGANQADLRTWETLPKQFQIARFATPADRQITITLPSGASLPPVKLMDGVVNVVYVKSVTAGQAPGIQQFILK